MPPDAPPPLFRETQSFDQFWVRLIVFGVAAVIWYGAGRQLLFGEPWGSNPAGDTLLVLLWVGFGLGFPALFLAIRLETAVDGRGISVRFRPFHRRPRSWRFEELERIEARTYSPLTEYGGWGIRIGPHGMAYNTSGNQGIQLQLRSGQRILLGTREPERFMRAVGEARDGLPPQRSSPNR